MIRPATRGCQRAVVAGAPSKVPAITVLEPSNAVLAALQILSARNPRIYGGEIEQRTVNTVVF